MSSMLVEVKTCNDKQEFKDRIFIFFHHCLYVVRIDICVARAIRRWRRFLVLSLLQHGALPPPTTYLTAIGRARSQSCAGSYTTSRLATG